MKIINSDLLTNTSGKASLSSRKRKNFNFHEHLSDSINRMLNAIEPGSYVQPHKHENPDKREIFILLKGKLAVVFFDELGNIKKKIILDGVDNIGVEIEPRVWHTIISLQKGTVVYEVKDGPYMPENDKCFAEWAPKENEKESEAFLKELIKDLALC